jgi:hypothetical protein
MSEEDLKMKGRLERSEKVMRLVDQTIDSNNLSPWDAVIFLQDLIGQLRFRVKVIREYDVTLQ